MPDLGQNHPLTDRIWDARAAAFIDEPTLVARLLRHRYVLLGERHDNPRHHLLQARLLRALVRKGRRPAVAWEMITDDQREALGAYLRSSGASADGLGQALRWEHSGWPPWRIYRPVAQVALEARLQLAAAGIARVALRRMLRPGPDTAPARPTLELPEAAVRDLQESVRASHCGHASGPMLEMMVLAQQLRDAHMARRLQEAARGDDGAVLIAGNGHVRRDRAVPFHLRGGGSPEGAEPVSLGILEVDGGELRAAPYAAGVEGMGPAFDYIWFTARVDNEDPCEKFREQLKRMGKKKH